MDERSTREILSEMHAEVTCINKKSEDFQQECENDKAHRIAIGNKALRGAVTGELIPRHEQFKLALDEIDMKILNVIDALSALKYEYEEGKTSEQIKQKEDRLYVDLSFWRLARGITEYANYQRISLIKDLLQGMEERDLAWYNNPEKNCSKYTAVLTINESDRGMKNLRNLADGSAVAILYPGKEFKELDDERSGKWEKDEDCIKVKEMIARKLGEFTEQGLIPPVSIRLYPESTHETVDYCALERYLKNRAVPYYSFIVVIEAECL